MALVSLYLAILPIIFELHDYLNRTYFSKPSWTKVHLVWGSAIFGGLGFVYLFVLKRRLKLTEISTNLTKKEIRKVVSVICREFKWQKLAERKNYFVLKADVDFWSFQAGEQIVIIIDGKRLFVNSIRDLEALRQGFGIIGNTSKNVEIIKKRFKEFEERSESVQTNE